MTPAEETRVDCSRATGRIRPAHSHGPEPSESDWWHFITWHKRKDSWTLIWPHVRKAITHPRGSEHISADIDVSACWQEADYKRHRFSFWRELRRTALRKQLKFWITWAEVEQERAAAQARDNEQQSIMRLGSSQVMTDNGHNWHGITQWNQHWTATVPPQSRTTTGIFTGWFDYSRLFGLSLLW